MQGWQQWLEDFFPLTTTQYWREAKRRQRSRQATENNTA